ncbi:hypothetical protein N790_05675 [Arenimonas malthae CC-JY-1]|uniref:Uncharacterized protein n=1 Tax=Arenimonas malthae CC-JY-1 TaxID=1384054 RepID=A0A091BBH5_9GAMM|nr:hypothetical protein N790_05675 [Arenimonas malthae CC-JY-1]
MDDGPLLFLQKPDQLLLRGNCATNAAVSMVKEPNDDDLLVFRWQQHRHSLDVFEIKILTQTRPVAVDDLQQVIGIEVLVTELVLNLTVSFQAEVGRSDDATILGMADPQAISVIL